MNPILKYDPQAIEELHKTCLSSTTIPDVASDPHVEEQTHAADRAYLRAGIHKDGDHRHKIRGFHPMFHALRDSTKTRGDRKGWIQAIRDDMWDAATALDRLTGGVTIITHSDCDLPAQLINDPGNSFADVYVTQRWLNDMQDELRAPLALMVNTFISNIQIPITERHRALSVEYLDLAFPANKDRANRNVIPQSPVPWRLRAEGRTTSPWRGQTRMPRTTAPLTRPSVTIPTSDHHSRTPSTTPPPSPSIASTASPASITYSDDEWFSQHDVRRAPPQRSTSVQHQSPEPPRTPEPPSSESHTSQSHSLRPQTRTGSTDSDDDIYWSGPLFWVDNTAHAARSTSVTAPTPTSTSIPSTSVPFTSVPSTSVPSTKPATFPYMTPDPIVGAHDTPIAVPNLALPSGSVSETKHAYLAFNPIVPPGPRTERWIEENGWHPRWANIFRDVAETYSHGKWVHILVTQYMIPIETAETIIACIIYDYDVQRTSTSFSTL